MKISLLTGSPHVHGSTNTLAESFASGAVEAGHDVQQINAAKADIHPCTGCLACGYNGPCVRKDDMEQIGPAILASDMIVFVSPLYYYGMTAQLKTLIDRFCSYDVRMRSRGFRSALITAAWNTAEWTFDAITTHYRTLVRYLGLTDCGMIRAYGCDNVT